MSNEQASLVRTSSPYVRQKDSWLPHSTSEGHRLVSNPIDPHLLEEFRLAEGARALFGELHRPIEPWLALQLARTDEDLLRREILRLTRLKQAGRVVVLGGLITDSLDRINLVMGRRARDLRAVLTTSGVPLDPARRDFVLAILLRDGASTPLQGEIRITAAEVEHYLNAPVRGPSDAVPVLPQGVDAELLQDLRRVDTIFDALALVRPKVELWEAFSLAVRSRSDEEQTSQRVRAPDPEIPDLCGALIEVRLNMALLSRVLRRYVSGLPIGHYSSDTMELAFAFILASPEGCRRARQWMESPEQFKREAAIRVEGVIGRAQKYLHALRAIA